MVNLKHNLRVRVRYAETDKMGVVYYGNYATYFEIGRVEWLRSMGITYAEMEAQGTMLPVVHMNIDFKRGAVYDEEITIETSVIEMPTRKISFYHRVLSTSNEVLVEGQVVLVFVDANTFKPKRCPEELTSLFKAGGLS